MSPRIGRKVGPPQEDDSTRMSTSRSVGPLRHPPPTNTTASADARPVSRLGLVTRAWHLANAVLENHMHQSISQRRAILEGLRQRCTLSTAEFYSKVGRPNPAPAPRFNVVPCGNGEFSIVDRSSDRTKAMCTGIDKAVRFAKRCDESPVAVQQSKPQANFGVLMLRWTAFFCLILGLFAFFGAHP